MVGNHLTTINRMLEKNRASTKEIRNKIAGIASEIKELASQLPETLLPVVERIVQISELDFELDLSINKERIRQEIAGIIKNRNKIVVTRKKRLQLI